MRVPLAARAHVKLHEPHAALDQPPGQQAVAAVAFGVLVVEAVERRVSAVSSRQIDRLRCGRLHAIGQLVRGDPGFELIVVGACGAVALVELLDEVELASLLLVVDNAGRRRDVQDRASCRRGTWCPGTWPA